MRSPRKLSIIIVNYRSEKYLEKCLASVYNWSDPSLFEIIVVNNDQSSDLSALVERYGEIWLCNAEKNIGFGAACNLGAKKAVGEILLFLNPDTQLLNDYVGKISDKFAKSPEKTGVIGPRLVTDERKTQEWCAGKDVTIWQLIKNNLWITESKKIWESKQEIVADWVSGAALAIKRDVFEKIGGFDEEFFMYGEDMDLCRRAREAGFGVIYDPTLVILHSCGKSRESWMKQKMQFYKSSIYYLLKKRKSV